MISNIIGYSSAIQNNLRQSAPQRQKVAFRGVDFGEPERRYSSKGQAALAACIAMFVAGNSAFQKNVNIPKLQTAIASQAKDKTVAKKIIAEGQKLTRDDSNKLTRPFTYSTEKGFLQEKLDSIHGLRKPVQRSVVTKDDNDAYLASLASQLLLW